jgi:general secretion pathway protein J
MRGARPNRGFTLVELLVALFAMALLAVMSWRGLDGMTRAQAQTEARADDVLALQVGLAQWAADLDAIIQLPQTAALDWNGRALRMTRRGTASPADGVVVAAWTRRVIDGNGTWLRWQSGPATTREQLQQAWQKADLWSQNPGDEERRGEVAITALEEWQIVYFRGGAWTNPQSSDAAGIFGAVGAPNTILPDGVRLILTLPPGQPITGRLTRDWARPTLSGGKS